MKEFRDYDQLFPELVYDILNYFRSNNSIKPIAQKSVIDYCANSRFNDYTPDHNIIQPDVVNLICKILEKKGVLGCINAGRGLSKSNANYLFMPNDEADFVKKSPNTVFLLNCMTYGFHFIYSSYRKYVLPVVVKKNNKNSMGTCFRLGKGIVTAKHCLDADEVYIPQYAAEKLNKCPIIVSADSDIDMAYIELEESAPLVIDETQVLDEVLVMGYPKIPMFFDFCAGERATISSIPTRGAVASLADQYISRSAGPLMLVTARVRGGNSGGPVIDAKGAVVGMAFSEPMAQGDYDEMGYGVAYPISVLNHLFQYPEPLEVKFVDRM